MGQQPEKVQWAERCYLYSKLVRVMHASEVTGQTVDVAVLLEDGALGIFQYHFFVSEPLSCTLHLVCVKTKSSTMHSCCSIVKVPQQIKCDAV